MGWVGWIILGYIILLAVGLFFLKREVKPNAHQKLSEAYRGIRRGMFSTGRRHSSITWEYFRT
jgi:hypothetical protein